MDATLPSNSFYLVFQDSSSVRNYVRFCIAQDDVKEAIAYGLVNPAEPTDVIHAAAARLKVVTMRVVRDIRLLSKPWVILRRGNIIGSSSHLVHPRRRVG